MKTYIINYINCNCWLSNEKGFVSLDAAISDRLPAATTTAHCDRWSILSIFNQLSAYAAAAALRVIKSQSCHKRLSWAMNIANNCIFNTLCGRMILHCARALAITDIADCDRATLIILVIATVACQRIVDWQKQRPSSWSFATYRP